MSSGNRPGASGGWSSTANMFTGDAKSVKLQAAFPQSEYYTMQFGVTPPNTPGSQLIFSCIAVITWKVEGNYVTRQISVTNGTSISGTAQAIDVALTDNTQNFGQTLNQPYQIGIQVVPGTRPTTNQPVILVLPGQNDQSLAPNNIATFDVPQNSGVISVEVIGVSDNVGVPEAPTIQVTLASASQSLKSYMVGLTNTGFISVPPGAVQIAIFNADQTNNAIYSIAWGIDG